jgi:acyl-CoA reductase-like NAD-dependent aldehyde dehydrogenase
MRRVRELNVGADTDPEAEVGPLVAAQLLDHVRSYFDPG